MSTEPPALGKGVFGYRKSAVNQIIADRDTMLRQAEGRVRAAEGKVSNLESELVTVQQRNQRMEEQLERLRAQVNALMGASPLAGAMPALDEESPAAADEPAPPAELAPSPAPPADEADAPPAYEISPSVQDEAGSEAWAASQPEESSPYPIEALSYEPQEEAEAPAEAEPAPMFEVDPFAAPETAEEPPADEVSPAADEVQPAAEGHEPGFDADAFGQHFVEYPEQDASYGYRYDWSEPAEASEASAASEPEDAAPEAPEAQAPPPEYETPTALEPPAEFDPFAALVPSEPTPAPPPPPAPAPAESGAHRSSDAASKLVSDELAGILAAAEESAARIIERARSTTSRQVARSNRVWQDVQSEVSKFVAWRQGVEPVIGAVQSKVDAVRELIEAVPERIREALAPMAESISAIDADLADLAAASTPPLLLTPSDLEPSEDDVEDWSSPDAPADHTTQAATEATSTSDEDDLSGPSYGYHAS